jgi:hypothetical protein
VIAQTNVLPLCCVLGSFIKDHLLVDVWIYLLALFCYVGLFFCWNCTFDHCSFVTYFEIRNYDASSFALAQNCFDYWESYVNLRFFFKSVKIPLHWLFLR